MVFVRDIATVSRPCSVCGRRVAVVPDRAAFLRPVYCPTCPQPETGQPTGAAWACEVCGAERHIRRAFGVLELCERCRDVAQSSCWRKGRYPNPPPRMIAPDGNVLWPYRCPLCRAWHFTSRPGGAPIEDQAWAAVIEALAELFAAIGFDIDQARGRTQILRTLPDYH